MLKRTAIKKFLATLERIEYGTLTVEMPDGKQYHFAGRTPDPRASLKIHDWSAIVSLVAKGDIGLAEAYRDKRLDTDNLTNLMRIGIQNADLLDQYIYGGWLSKWVSQCIYFFQHNTVRGSKRNVQAHYDLGNDFYELWLDKSMTYSSGLFRSPEHSLEQAQQHKYDRILERLAGKSGRLLEIGCGWGGFAQRALDGHDLDIKGITISQQQYQFAKRKLRDKTHIALEDYRIQTGKYDQIVSIEMFEAVGEKFWPVYFNKIKSLLNRQGKAVIQTITIGDSFFEHYRKTGDMLRSFIFPGGLVPSPARFRQEAEKAGLRVTDEFSFGQDYATTLHHWLGNFEKCLPQVKALNFDENFIRIWRFYLSICIAGFTEKRTSVYQFELQHG